jgi:homoserine dehydrogenase
MFELANRLVGIYKTNDATKSVTINPHLFEQSVAGSRVEPSQGAVEISHQEIENRPAKLIGAGTRTGSRENARLVLADTTNRLG